jgi:hypothetical protein
VVNEKVCCCIGIPKRSKREDLNEGASSNVEKENTLSGKYKMTRKKLA